jgi:hypothetical protein
MALLAVSAGEAGIAPGSLFCCNGAFQAAGNPTHYDVQVGQTVTARIDGATDVSAGATTISVFVKSSALGNTTLTATRIAGTNNFAFTYNAPSIGCDTTIVAYQALGNNANNDYRDDGLKNDSAKAAAGFRFVDAQGSPIACSLAQLSGMKFEDLNANGVKDSGEPGLAGWTIKLDGTDINGLAVHLTTSTDGSGNYAFTGLNPGAYTVSEVLQSGWHQSYPAGGTYAVSLVLGQNSTGNDFGNWRPAEIRGHKFFVFDSVNCWNIDGHIYPGVASNWQINLSGTDGMGNAVALTAYADANCNYAFTNLMPGTYTVVEVLPPSPPYPRWEAVYPANPCLCYTDTLVSGQVVTGRDFGNGA